MDEHDYEAYNVRCVTMDQSRWRASVVITHMAGGYTVIKFSADTGDTGGDGISVEIEEWS